MKYAIDMELERPRDVVVELFDNTDNLKQWQPELISFEHQSGEKGAAGARSKLVYQMGKREVEMIETILVRKLPDEFSGTYEAKGVWNRVDNKFTELGPDKTEWHCETEFKCSGIMRLFALFAPGKFKKETRRYMDQFKAFVERV